MDEQIQIRINTDEKELVKKAGRVIGLGHSTFSRMATLEKARKILRENSEVAVV